MMKKQSSLKPSILSTRPTRFSNESGFSNALLPVIQMLAVLAVGVAYNVSNVANTASANSEASMSLNANVSEARTARADASANMTAVQKLGVAVQALKTALFVGTGRTAATASSTAVPVGGPQARQAKARAVATVAVGKESTAAVPHGRR